MKNNKFVREVLTKMVLFYAILISIILSSLNSFGQQTYPGESRHEPGKSPGDTASHLKQDTTHQKNQVQSPGKKLTPEQIKKIVGKDKLAGRDAQGHTLYEDFKGQKYYVTDYGIRIYIK